MATIRPSDAACHHSPYGSKPSPSYQSVLKTLCTNETEVRKYLVYKFSKFNDDQTLSSFFSQLTLFDIENIERQFFTLSNRQIINRFKSGEATGKAVDIRTSKLIRQRNCDMSTALFLLTNLDPLLSEKTLVLEGHCFSAFFQNVLKKRILKVLTMYGKDY
ncbi:hypothetical protein JQC92_21950 [Shewanella sp. 202IG2-18]|uniref:hypothetical protein n=1 Tax=Parashewanella hymeniacidonis TaxID=2807618 RepID=UPI001961824B|nr:hypothetical protein [Parashewanella hymeniacidonis]MBM7074640.1 hypothetical protein [Parashewanella hymeniacidonis]